jgi:tRNA A37 threonylcarbamoyladenosine synthetase subunit TsaC/SUA5/YrdC
MYRSTFSRPRYLLELSGQLLAPAALPPGKESPVLLGQWSGRRGQDKNNVPTGTRTLNPRPSSPYPVALLTALTTVTSTSANISFTFNKF